MVYVGTDIIEIERVRKAVERHPALWDRILTPEEKAYCQAKGDPVQSLAGRFAAKEAVLKCAGLGLRRVSWLEMEIFPTQNGAPQVRCTGLLEQYMAEKGIKEIKLSISHCRQYAVAVAVGVVSL